MKIKNYHRICTVLLALLLFCTALPGVSYAEGRDVVRVGWFYQPGYQEVDSDGNPSGYNYEFLLKLSEQNNWQLDFITKNAAGSELTWNESLSMLASGELDIMGCMLYSDERAEQYDYSTLSAGQAFTSLFVREDSPLTSNDLTALNGISVAVNMSSLNDEDLNSFSEDSGFTIGRFIDCDDLQEVSDAVVSGAADAGVMASYQPEEDTRIIASFAPRSFYFATTKGNTAVLSDINQGMNSIFIQNPYYAQNLSEKYNQTYSGQIVFSKQEQEYITNAEPIRVCYSNAWYPLIQADGDAKHPSGVIPDILAEVSVSTGLQFEFYHVDTHEEALENSATGACDMLAVCIYDLRHSKKYHVGMTDPYLQMQLVMVSRTQTDSEDMTIGTMADFPLFDEAAESENTGSLKYFSTAAECFEALRRQEVDSIVVGAYTANYYLALSRYNGFLRTNLPGQYAPISMAVSEAYEDESLLLSVLNKSISNLSSTEINRIMLDNTVKDGSGLEAVVNRIPSTVIMLALIILLTLSILIICMAAALVHKSKLARRQAEEKKAEAEKVAQLLRIDSLTGLYNERGFDAAARRRLDEFTNRQWFLVDFDVDGFKYVNALYGKEQADELLIALTKIVVEEMQPEEICGRIYGDHFVALLYGEAIEDIRQRILNVNESFRGFTDRYLVIMSYGIYPIVDRSAPVSLLCDHAQVAKRQVKGNYKEFIAVYDDAMDRRQKDDMELILSVDRALEDREFEAFFQPQYDIKTEKIVSAEALVRWRHGDRLIMPDRFIGLFESNGLIEKLDFYMVKTVCAHLKAQLDEGLSPVPVAVNFSKSHLYDQMFLSTLKSIIADSHIPAELLVAEFTEYTCLGNESAFRTIIRELHQIGLRVSLDDFGSGYSSLNILNSMDFDEIKLDKDFLKESPLRDKTKNMIRSILQLMKGQHIHTVAEGVETREQLDFLRESGCDTAQGYYFSRPVPGEAYDELLRKRREK